MTKTELQAALVAANIELANANARIGKLTAEVNELAMKLRGQIKRGNILKANNATPTAPLRTWKEASELCRNGTIKGMTVEQAMHATI